MEMQLISAAEVNDGVRRHLTVSEAATAIGCSESRIRRAARRLGVTKIAGNTVRGGILIPAHPVAIVITYCQ